MQDFDDRLARLLDRTERFNQRLAASLDNSQPAEATSEGGGVRVRVRGDGTIESVDVFDGWRRETTPEALGSLILTTMGSALAGQFGKWAELAPDAMDRTVTRQVRRTDTHAVTPPRGASGDHTVPDAIRSTGGLAGAFDELVASLQQVANQTHEGHDRAGHATAVADGRGTLTDVRFDQDWLDGVAARLVGPSATEAMTNAVTRSRASSDYGQVVGNSRLGRLQDTLTNPRPDND